MDELDRSVQEGHELTGPGNPARTAAIRASNGQGFEYPGTLRFVK